MGSRGIYTCPGKCVCRLLTCIDFNSNDQCCIPTPSILSRHTKYSSIGTSSQLAQSLLRHQHHNHTSPKPASPTNTQTTCPAPSTNARAKSGGGDAATQPAINQVNCSCGATSQRTFASTASIPAATRARSQRCGRVLAGIDRVFYSPVRLDWGHAWLFWRRRGFAVRLMGLARFVPFG